MLREKVLYGGDGHGYFQGNFRGQALEDRTSYDVCVRDLWGITDGLVKRLRVGGGVWEMGVWGDWGRVRRWGRVLRGGMVKIKMASFHAWLWYLLSA